MNIDLLISHISGLFNSPLCSLQLMTDYMTYATKIRKHILVGLKCSPHLNQLMRLWYLSHRATSQAQASLHIFAVSPEPSLFAHMKYGSRRRVPPTSSPKGNDCSPESNVPRSICPNTLCSLSPTPMMLHIKFDQDWPTGFRDIQVQKCEIFVTQGQVTPK